MACKRSAVRSRLPPPDVSPSSRGLGHHPFTVGTGVRIPLEMPSSLPVHAAGSPFLSGRKIQPFQRAVFRKIHYNNRFLFLFDRSCDGLPKRGHPGSVPTVSVWFRLRWKCFMRPVRWRASFAARNLKDWSRSCCMPESSLS